MIKKIIKLFNKLFGRDLYFIGSADKLPAPLSKEEEVKYVTMAMDGSEMTQQKKN